MTDDAPKTKRRDYLDPIKAAQAVKSLRESIAAVDPDDEQLLLDTIEGETPFFEIVDALLLRMAVNRGHALGLKKIAVDMETRAERFDKRVEDDRALVEQAMMIAEVEKIERPAATLTLAKRQPKVEISTESEIPSEFWKAGEPSLDRKALLAALKEGRPVPGAHLTNAAPSLTVRTA